MVLKNKKLILHIVCVLTCVFVLFFSISPVKADAFGYQTNEQNRTFADFPLVYTGRVGGRQAYGLPFPSSVSSGDINSQYPIEYGFNSSTDSLQLIKFIMQADFDTSRFAYSVSAMYPSASDGAFDRNANFACPYPVLMGANSYLIFLFPVACTYTVQATLWTYSHYATEDKAVSDMTSQPFTRTISASANEGVDVLSTIVNTEGVIISNLFVYVELASPCQTFIVATSANNDPQTRFTEFASGLDFSYDLENNVTIVESDFPTDWTEWMIETVSGFFAFEIAPGLSFGVIFISIFGVLLLWFILHLFM